MGRLTWLGGHDTGRDVTASVNRARKHRRHLAKTAAAADRWEDADRVLHKAGFFRRR